MAAVPEMLQTHPQKPTTHFDEIRAAIEACFETAQTATICADSCIGEENIAELRECIRLDLDCAEFCAATGRLIARQTHPQPDFWRAALQACIQACRSCAAECAKHAAHHEHCRINQESCERCMAACQRLLDVLPEGGAETRH